MKLLNKPLIFVVLFLVSSCNYFDFDKQDDPNAVTPENAGVEYVYNNIQINFNTFFRTAHNFGSRPSRMLAMTGGGTYASSFGPGSFNGIWNSAYAELFPDMALLETLATEKGLDIHIATSNIMKAYVITTLVDIFGDVPYSEINQGLDKVSPKTDDSQVLYNEAISLLESAVTTLGSTSANKPDLDMFYNGSKSAWINLANTLKIRIYNNTRLIDNTAGAKIKAIVDAGDFIKSSAGDFEYKYGTNRANPNNRHPDYNDSYENDDATYQSNYYMWLFLTDGNKLTENDPRIRFYFYRQKTNLLFESPTVWECYLSGVPIDGPSDTPSHYAAVDPDMAYCLASFGGYFGRDHGNDEGIPPDGPLRTVYGVYPAGGSFDDNSAEYTQKSGTQGALGAGINPIMLSSYVDFIRAEAGLMAGTGEAPRGLLESGIRKSMDKVFSFNSLVDGSKVVGKDPVTGFNISLEEAYFADWATYVDNYVTDVMAIYDAAASDDERLDVIMTEYLKSLYGNGIEAYNNLRRTSMPSNVQPAIDPDPGVFIWSAFYPTDFVERNANATQKAITDKVFWDNTPIDAVK